MNGLVKGWEDDVVGDVGSVDGIDVSLPKADDAEGVPKRGVWLVGVLSEADAKPKTNLSEAEPELAPKGAEFEDGPVEGDTPRLIGL